VKTRVAVLISGRGSNMAALIEAAKDPTYPAEIALVISNKANAAGLDTARRAGVAAACIPSRDFGTDKQSHEAAVEDALTARQIELVCLAGYMRLLSPHLVQRWSGRILNIHPSLLPAYKGLDTHARVLAGGERTHGCTVHLVTADMDDGPILAQAAVPVLPGDTEATLAARVLEQEHQLYPATLARYIMDRALPEGEASR
jgi:formyltetrahydrofolate-dependent phosphoribosylglycinamide formyltransferase